MIKQPRPSNLLLIPPTQRLTPLVDSIPTTFSLDDMVHLDNTQNPQQLVIRDAIFRINIRVSEEVD